MNKPEEVLNVLAGYSLQWEVCNERTTVPLVKLAQPNYSEPEPTAYYVLCILLFAPRQPMLDDAFGHLSDAILINRGAGVYFGSKPARRGAEYLDGVAQFVDLMVPAANGVEARAWVARRLGIQEAKPRGR